MWTDADISFVGNAPASGVWLKLLLLGEECVDMGLFVSRAEYLFKECAETLIISPTLLGQFARVAKGVLGTSRNARGCSCLTAEALR